MRKMTMNQDVASSIIALQFCEEPFISDKQAKVLAKLYGVSQEYTEAILELMSPAPMTEDEVAEVEQWDESWRFEDSRGRSVFDR